MKDRLSVKQKDRLSVKQKESVKQKDRLSDKQKEFVKQKERLSVKQKHRLSVKQNDRLSVKQENRGSEAGEFQWSLNKNNYDNKCIIKHPLKTFTVLLHTFIENFNTYSKLMITNVD